MGNVKLVVLFILALLHTTFAGYFHTVEETNDEIILEWNAPNLTWQSVQIGTENYVKPICGTLPYTTESGVPLLPFDVYVTTYSGSYSIQVLDSTSSIISTGKILPAPSMQYNDENEIAKTLYSPASTIYNRNAFTQDQFVACSTAHFDHQKYLRIQLNPLKYNPAVGTVEYVQYLKIRIRKIKDPAVKKLSKVQLNPVSESIKIEITDEGIYKIPISSLQELGVPVSSLTTNDFRLTNRGKTKPLYFLNANDEALTSTSSLLFYGERLAGEDQYYNDFSNTNVYFLTWQGNGLGYSSVSPTVEGAPIDRIRYLAHFEKDVEYYNGDDDPALHNSFETDGEGWVWNMFIDPNVQVPVDFDLPGLVQGAENAFVQVRVRGETQSYQYNDHHIQIVLNDSIFVDSFFQDREERTFTFSVPANRLKEKKNRIIIKSIFQTDDLISRFYFDWFKVEYSRRLQTENGLLSFYSLTGEFLGYRISNLPTGNIMVWDTENAVSIEPSVINQSWIAGLKVQSAGMADGSLARFYLDDGLIYQGTRGISIVTLNALDGKIVESVTFDTHGTQSASDSLADYLNSLPEGTLVMSAIGDEGTRNLTETAKAAFRSLGSQAVDSLQYRDNWAAVFCKGEGLIVEKFTGTGTGLVQIKTDVTFSFGSDSYNVIFGQEESNGHFVICDMDSVKTPKISFAPETDLLSQQFDYLVITHPFFQQQAQQLADYRSSHNGFQSKVVLVDDIYNQFSHGIKSPTALRDFLKAAYEQWKVTPPRFVALFGDASWDPKLNNPDSKRIDYVPTIGSPVSDALIVCLDDTLDVVPDLSVGRIPVKSIEEAQAAVDKIITYESMPSAEWKKNFFMISGGFDDYEQRTFNRQSRELSDSFINTDPVFGDTYYISKETEELDEGEYSYKIVDMFNQGMLWGNFIGHAGSRTWELMFHNPDIENLENTGKYPFISSMTCHTGRFASPVDDSFGEHFILTAQKGAIGFMGTSGWGYSYEDYQYLRQLFPTALQDSIRYLGDIILETKHNVWKNYGLSNHYRNLILQYNLLGDPAVQFALPEQPDFAINVSDIKINPVSPFESDSTAEVNIVVHNYGLIPQDSLQIDLNIFAKESKLSYHFSKTLSPIAKRDTIQFVWPLKNMVGDVDLTVNIDLDNDIVEVDESNNQISILATVLSSNIRIISPFTDALVPSQNVYLKIENPSQRDLLDLAFEFQIDTSLTFNSLLLKKSGIVNAGIIATGWNAGNLLPDQNYYWRVRDADSEFESDWITTSFATESTEKWGWQQNRVEQFSSNQINNLKISSNSVRLQQHQIEIRAESAGVQDGNFARIFIDRESIITEPQRGINMVAVDTTCYSVLDARIFDTHISQEGTDSMIDFINQLAPGTLVCAGIKDEGSRNLTEAAYQALEQIGSSLIRQVGYRDSWAIIGIKGSPIGSAIESHRQVDEGDAVAVMTRDGYYLSGALASSMIGPSLEWQELSADVESNEKNSVLFSVLGYATRQSEPDTLISHKEIDKIDIASIDASTYPYISLAAMLQTYSIKTSPVMKKWLLHYTPAPDLAVSPQVFSQSVDSLLVGQTVSLYFDLYNIGLSPSDSVLVKFEQSHPTLGRETFAKEKLGPIPADKYKPIKKDWHAGVEKGVKQLFLTIDADRNNVELNETNNTLVTSVYVHEDTLKPELALTFDDVEIFDGDLVSANPQIIAKIFDNSPEAIDDTNQVSLYLDGEKITFTETNGLQLVPPIDDESGTILFTPELNDGKHEIDIVVSDASRNEFIHHIEFKVESDLALYNLLNYPNPFEDFTEIRFELTQPAEVEIRIFTIAGRLIRKLDPGYLSTGYQSVDWDGLDSLGDRLANGTYLYKVTVNGDTETVSKIGKAVVMN